MYEIMKKQGHEEETGKTKITSGYNLPATYILHTVGPIIQWEVTGKEEELLASCYRECLKLAADTGAESVAFCCLSTGVFRFPQQRAAEIATETVKNYINEMSIRERLWIMQALWKPGRRQRIMTCMGRYSMELEIQRRQFIIWMQDGHNVWLLRMSLTQAMKALQSLLKNDIIFSIK